MNAVFLLGQTSHRSSLSTALLPARQWVISRDAQQMQTDYFPGEQRHCVEFRWFGRAGLESRRRAEKTAWILAVLQHTLKYHLNYTFLSRDAGCLKRGRVGTRKPDKRQLCKLQFSASVFITATFLQAGESGNHKPLLFVLLCNLPQLPCSPTAARFKIGTFC